MVLLTQGEEVAHLLLYWMDRLGVKLPAPAAVAFMTSARCPKVMASNGSKAIDLRDATLVWGSNPGASQGLNHSCYILLLSN